MEDYPYHRGLVDLHLSILTKYNFPRKWHILRNLKVGDCSPIYKSMFYAFSFRRSSAHSKITTKLHDFCYCWTPELVTSEPGEPPEDGTTRRRHSAISDYLRMVMDVMAKVNPVLRTTLMRSFDFKLPDRTHPPFPTLPEFRLFQSLA